MKLLLDLGNSAVKWAAVPPAPAPWRTGRLAYAEASGPEGVVSALRDGLGDAAAPTRICVASVLSRAWQRELDAALQRAWPVPVHHLASTASAAGVINAYHRPEQLGVDRWAALIGARARSPGGACIVDIGTAITVDGLDAEGRHVGGAIYPGLRLLHEALARGTARLPDPGPAASPELPACSTADGIRAGIGVGTPAAVAALAEAILAACPDGSQRLLTGGGADELAPALGPGWCHRPHLVLEGLLHWSTHEAPR